MLFSTGVLHPSFRFMKPRPVVFASAHTSHPVSTTSLTNLMTTQYKSNPTTRISVQFFAQTYPGAVTSMQPSKAYCSLYLIKRTFPTSPIAVKKTAIPIPGSTDSHLLFTCLASQSTKGHHCSGKTSKASYQIHCKRSLSKLQG